MSTHVFICYARLDQDFVHDLTTKLTARGVSVWLDLLNLRPGTDWDQSINQAIHDCAHFLIVLSPAAVRSREVRGELHTALNENKSIVPIFYQKCTIPRQLQTIEYADCTSSGLDDFVLDQILETLSGSILTRQEKNARRAVEALKQPERARFFWMQGVVLTFCLATVAAMVGTLLSNLIKFFPDELFPLLWDGGNIAVLVLIAIVFGFLLGKMVTKLFRKKLGGYFKQGYRLAILLLLISQTVLLILIHLYWAAFLVGLYGSIIWVIHRWKQPHLFSKNLVITAQVVVFALACLGESWWYSRGLHTAVRVYAVLSFEGNGLVAVDQLLSISKVFRTTLAACRREKAMTHYKALRLVRSRPFA
jgi:hypothetical protein